MPTLKVHLDDETHEVDTDQVELPEDYDLVHPDNASQKGYFTQAQLNNKIQNRLKKERKKVKSDLKEDDEFLKETAEQRFGIQFDEDGNPKGLEPDVDPDEIRKKAMDKVREDYEPKLEKEQKQKQTYKQRLIEKDILSATKGDWREEYTKYQDKGRVKPIAVNQFKELFDVDEDGNVALLDSDGEGFAVNPQGQHITPGEYLTDEDKFGDFMVDKRQKGSGFNKGDGSKNGKPVFTEKEIAEMSDAEYEEKRDEIKRAQADGRVQ